MLFQLAKQGEGEWELESEPTDDTGPLVTRATELSIEDPSYRILCVWGESAGEIRTSIEMLNDGAPVQMVQAFVPVQALYKALGSDQAREQLEFGMPGDKDKPFVYEQPSDLHLLRKWIGLMRKHHPDLRG